MANAKTGKKKEAVSRAEVGVPDPAEAFERLKAATRHLATIPKAELDRRAKAWAKARKRKRHHRAIT